MSQRNHRPLFLIDLGLPRNIDSQAQEVYNVFLYNLDDLQSIAEENRRERQKDIPKAERIVGEEVQKFMQWQQSLLVVPTVKSLRRKAEQIRQSELEAHLRKLNHLSEHERGVITALTHAIVNKILHEPTVRLKQSADAKYLESIRYLFDLEGEE
jgi:glutamyl-tRNA reductase